MRTGDVVRSVNPTFALNAGDLAYDNGTLVELQTKYDPTWGSFKAITRPTPGNHEYNSPNAQGYDDYFFSGVSSGNEYYAFDCGAWRLYSLNCEIACGEGSAELAWLRNDLAANPGRHYMGYLHQPRFTSGSGHGPNDDVADVYAAIQSAGGDVLVSAHNHQYERFGKQNANGVADPLGLRQFVVGSGGAGLTGFGSTQANSQFRDAEHYGVLKLVLSDLSYSWQFLSAGRTQVGSTDLNDLDHPLGTVLDQGSESTNLGGGGNRPPIVSRRRPIHQPAGLHDSRRNRCRRGASRRHVDNDMVTGERSRHSHVRRSGRAFHDGVVLGGRVLRAAPDRVRRRTHEHRRCHCAGSARGSAEDARGPGRVRL